MLTIQSIFCVFKIYYFEIKILHVTLCKIRCKIIKKIRTHSVLIQCNKMKKKIFTII